MKYLAIFLVLVGFVGTSFAEELGYTLTPFDIILHDDDFTEGPNHNILLLERNQSATINITIQNNDDKLHKITFTNPKYSSNLFDYFVFEPEQIMVHANQENSTKLYLKIANDTNTHSSFTTFLAQSDVFGMKGIGFVIVVDREIDELTDKLLRAGLPGHAFPKMNGDISEYEAEKMIDNGFGTPKFLPDDYQFQGMTDWGQSKQFLYSPISIDNSTESIDFWAGGGMMINYYNNADRPNINNTKSLPVRIAQDEGQQIVVNGLMGMAIEKQTRMVAYSDTTHDVPSEVEFFDDAKRSAVSLRANMSLDELLKVASSIPSYDENDLIPDKSNNVFVDLVVNSPLKQFKSGVPADEIECRDSLVLVTKNDVSPACVTLDSVPKLIDRKWIGHLSPQNIGELGMGYVSLYVLSNYADPDQKIAMDFSGPSLITEKIINYYDVDVLSRKITDDGKFSENFGTMTKQNMKEFFEKNPPSVVIENGLSVFPLGGFKDNTGTYGPFNQFLSDDQLQELKKMFGDENEN